MNPHERPIVVVSGLPRSGTSMMMRALAAGGVPVLTDHVRHADADNPYGYWEFEPAKVLGRDNRWLGEAQGKAVKLVSALLRHLRPEYTYRIIFMQRDLGEVLASQRAMLHRQGTAVRIDDARLGRLFEQHLNGLHAWLAQQPNIRVLDLQYYDVVFDAAVQFAAVRDFLGRDLSIEAMMSVVDPRLHHQRSRQG